MTHSRDLKEFEKKAFRATFQDGFLDIFLGIVFAQFAIGQLLTDIGYSDMMSSLIFMPIYVIGLVL